MNREIQQFVKQRALSDSPVCGESFAKGDKVTFTNDNGVVFTGHTITGFSSPIYEGSGTVYLDYDCYWFPAKPANLTKEA